MITDCSSKNIVAKNLEILLMQKSISRKKICTDCGFKYTTFCDWINGKSEPKIDALEKMSEYLDIAVGDFFVEFDSNKDFNKRISKYADLNKKELNGDILNNLSDKEIEELIKAGFTFRRLSLEEYAGMFNRPIAPTTGADWGDPVEGERW